MTMIWYPVELPFLSRGRLGLSTPQGRARDRLRRIGLTSIAATSARGIAVATAFFTVPLTLHYLGAERYGMWSTLSSLIALASFADIGLGNGLLNALARAHGLDDASTAQREISTAFLVLTAISILLAVSFTVGYRYVDWGRVFNVESIQARQEAGPATAVFIACFLFNVPLAIVARVRQAYQEAYKTSLFDAGGNIVGLVLLVVAIRAHASIVWLVVAMAGTPAISSLIHWAVLFGRDRPWLRVSLRAYDLSVARHLLQQGLLFFALQLAAGLFYAPDNFILAQLRGPESVAKYAVVAKLFSVCVLMAEVTLSPVWPAYREAMARGDNNWVRRMLVNSVAIAAVASTLFAFVLVVVGNAILTAWWVRE